MLQMLCLLILTKCYFRINIPSSINEAGKMFPYSDKLEAKIKEHGMHTFEVKIVIRRLTKNRLTKNTCAFS